MRSSRGMGDINPSKMPRGKKTARRDDTDFTQYGKGGSVGLYANINAKKNVSLKALVRRCVKLAVRVRPQRKHSLTQLKLPKNEHNRFYRI